MLSRFQSSSEQNRLDFSDSEVPQCWVPNRSTEKSHPHVSTESLAFVSSPERFNGQSVEYLGFLILVQDHICRSTIQCLGRSLLFHQPVKAKRQLPPWKLCSIPGYLFKVFWHSYQSGSRKEWVLLVQLWGSPPVSCVPGKETWHTVLDLIQRRSQEAASIRRSLIDPLPTQPMFKFSPWPTSQLHQPCSSVPTSYHTHADCLWEIDCNQFCVSFWFLVTMLLMKESLASVVERRVSAVFRPGVQVAFIPFVSICICHIALFHRSPYHLLPCCWRSFCLWSLLAQR